MSEQASSAKNFWIEVGLVEPVKIAQASTQNSPWQPAFCTQVLIALQPASWLQADFTSGHVSHWQLPHAPGDWTWHAVWHPPQSDASLTQIESHQKLQQNESKLQTHC